MPRIYPTKKIHYCLDCGIVKFRSDQSPRCRTCYIKNQTFRTTYENCIDCGKEKKTPVSYERCIPCARTFTSKHKWENIESLVEKTSTCWIWKGSIDGKGYGRYRRFGKMHLAHRLMYERYKGPIPKGLFGCHSCDNKICCRPDHIFIGNNSDNMKDASLKGLKGKLTPKDVVEIRKTYIPRKKGSNMSDLAKRYEVVQQTISSVVHGNTWKHIS